MDLEIFLHLNDADEGSRNAAQEEILNAELDILHECRATKEDDIIAKLSKLGYYV